MSRRVRRKVARATPPVYPAAVLQPRSVEISSAGVVKTTRMLSATLLPWLLLLVPFLQAVVIFWAIWSDTGSVPFADEWSWVPLLAKLHTGTLSLSDLWAPHNQHRDVIPRLLALPMLNLTAWNRQMLMTLNLLVGVMSTLFVVLAIRSTARSAKVNLLPLLPISYLVLSLGGAENWFLPFQITFLLTMLGAVICVWAFAHPVPDWRVVGYGLGGGCLASLSTLGGLLVWPAFLPSVLRAGWKATAVWLATGAVIAIPYSIGLDTGPSQHGSLFDVVGYVLTFLGTSMGTSVEGAQWFGVFSMVALPLGISIYYGLTRSLDAIHVWISAAIFGLLNAVVTAQGRAILGVAQALSGRYLAVSLFWWLGALVISGLAVQCLLERAPSSSRNRFVQPRAMVGAIGAALGVLLLISNARVNVDAYRANQLTQDRLKGSQQCVLSYQIAPDSCLRLFFPNTAYLGQLAAYLQDHKLAAFANSSQPAALVRKQQVSGMSLLTVNGLAIRRSAPGYTIVRSGVALHVGGTVSNSSTTSAYAVNVDQRVSVPLSLQRGSLVVSNGPPAISFDAVIPARYIPPGVHLITVIATPPRAPQILLASTTFELLVE